MCSPCPLSIQATGAHNIPQIPGITRRNSALREYHSLQLRDPSILAGSSVVVVGGGASAMDLLDLCFQHGAETVHWVYRSVRWIFPTSRPKGEAAGLRSLARRQVLGLTARRLSDAINPGHRRRRPPSSQRLRERE